MSCDSQHMVYILAFVQIWKLQRRTSGLLHLLVLLICHIHIVYLSDGGSCIDCLVRNHPFMPLVS